MTTRRGTLADVDRIVAMGSRFVGETTYQALITPNPAQMAQTVSALMNSADGCVFVGESASALVGMIGMVMITHHVSGERVAGEVFWWVEPEHRGGGLKLLKAAERWAKEQQATAIQMIAPTPAVGQLYTRLGYAPVETTYQRAL